MKPFAYIFCALIIGCATPTKPLQQRSSSKIIAPLDGEERQILVKCETDINKIMAGVDEQGVKPPVYSAYERTALMTECLESRNITDERIRDIFTILVGASDQ